MKKFKITLFLETPVILDRLTTIDSIFLSSYYALRKAKGFNDAFDKTHKSVDFIHRENGVFSGSIWYIDKDEFIDFDFATIVKKPEYEKIYQTFGKKVRTSVLYKAALQSDELMLVKKLHFYIKGDAIKIEALLQHQLKSIGKYIKLGYGKISDYEMEEIDEDKGFMLNDSTPSKPLPVVDFKMNSKKITFSRRMAPYWLNEDLEACYMPTTSLYEYVDKSASNSKLSVSKNLEYISNVQFLYDKAHDKNIVKDSVEFKRSDYSDFKPHKKYKFKYTKENETLRCAFSGDIKKEGMAEDTKQFMTLAKQSFSDYIFMSGDDFISKETLWSIDNISALSYVMADNKTWSYLQGKLAKDGERINDLIADISLLNPPFSLNLKKDKNSQHVVFKGKVSISTGSFFVQIGNKTLLIDGELLIEALNDISSITKEYPEISKTHLCRNFKDYYDINLKKKNREVNTEILRSFQKRYDTNIRNLLALLAL